jgi:predicted nucleic acid-binding protein/GNAT superfamily N-acetyltransferase
MNIEFIDHTSKFLKDVIELGSKNSNTLGFLPEGGFHDHAKKYWIIIAEVDNELLGYLLFRLGSKTSRVSITHLCVRPEYRGKGVSTALLDKLKFKYSKSHAGIILSCRKDYKAANLLWEKYGFVSKKIVRSRSTDEKYLIKWWYDFNQADLFNFYDQSFKVKRVMLDANIVIKLREENTPEHNEVKALIADWLSDEVEYYFAPELYNEINRDNDRERAEKTRKFIQNTLTEARLNKEDLPKIIGELAGILPGNNPNDTSDRKQLAECIASGIEYFITGDGPIITKRKQIQKLYNIAILNPAEFILEIDEITSTSSYNPSRLSGALQSTKKVNNDEIESFIDRFLFKRFSEPKNKLKSKINYILQDLRNGSIKTVFCPEKGDIAFWGHIIKSDKIEIPFFRIINNSLAQTLFTQLISETVSIAIQNGRFLIEISEEYLLDYQKSILMELGFIQKESSWFKIAIKGLIKSDELITKFPYILNYFDPEIFEKINNLQNVELKTKLQLQIERALFPLKFSNLEIPCYIIPIKPFWASQLFDLYTSNNTIFGAQAEKIWNRQNVYYRNIKPVSEKFPARILWYASSEKDYARQKGIIAASYLDNVSIGPCKQEFNKYKKYGIYEWKDLYKLAENDINHPVKTLLFSDTEVFKKIVPFRKIADIFLVNNRRKNTFSSPVEVNTNIFNDVYTLNL